MVYMLVYINIFELLNFVRIICVYILKIHEIWYLIKQELYYCYLQPYYQRVYLVNHFGSSCHVFFELLCNLCKKKYLFDS